MDADLYKEAIEYELLTRTIYQEILRRDGAGTVDVKHNVSLQGRSGVEHQIDVFWEFKQAGVMHRVLIECKNYTSSLTLEKARNFFGVIHDIGNCAGIMVTRTGYQAGVTAFCKFYGIALKLLRPPVDEDWKDRIKKIHVSITPRVPSSTEQRPIVCSMFLRPNSEAQEQRLQAALKRTPQLVASSANTRLLDKHGDPNTEEFRWWLPRQLNVLDYPDGGPYEKAVPLEGHYVNLDLGNGVELVQVIGVKIQFWVETLDKQEVVIDAVRTVDAILKDNDTGEIEFIHRTGHLAR